MAVETVRKTEMNIACKIGSSDMEIIVGLYITSYEPVHVFWLKKTIDVKSTIVNILMKIALTMRYNYNDNLEAVPIDILNFLSGFAPINIFYCNFEPCSS